NAAALVDGRDAVGRFTTRPVDLQPCAGPSPCLRDWVHLDRVGHEVIARALFETLAAHPSARLRALQAMAPAIDRVPEIRSVTPPTLDPFTAPSIVLEGTGMASRSAIDRVWIAGRLARHEVLDDRHLRCELDAPLPPGEHDIEVVTAAGLARSDMRLV